jgi:hypothetical protein
VGSKSLGTSVSRVLCIQFLGFLTHWIALGTCTRCPLEVRLQQSDYAWTARVVLRLEVDMNGKSIHSIVETPFGPTITDPILVEGILRRAQLAILNPSLAPQVLLDLDQASLARIKGGSSPSGSTKQLSFSTNVVCISIAGPQVADLTFLDLPVRASLVDLVLGLTLRYS